MEKLKSDYGLATELARVYKYPGSYSYEYKQLLYAEAHRNPNVHYMALDINKGKYRKKKVIRWKNIKKYPLFTR